MPLDDAGRAMVAEYKNLARSAAWSFWRRAPRADLDELQGIAYVALCQAAERFPSYNAEHGYAPDDFSHVVAFLRRRVNGAILDWARSEDWLTRAQRRTLKIIEDAAWPGASTAELAGASGIAEDEVRSVLAAAASKPVYLPQTPDDGAASSVVLAFQDPAADVEAAASVRAMLGAVVSVFRGLPLQQQVIIARLYIHGQTLAEAAEALAIAKEEASQLHQDAVLVLHEAMIAQAADGCPCGRDGGSCGCSAQ